MKSATFICALLAAALPWASAQAKTHAIPDADPIATVSIPDTWETNEYEGGVEGTSPDGTIYFAVEEVVANDVGTAVEDGVKFFEGQGLTIDKANITTKDVKVNGLEAFDMTLPAKDKDGVTSAGMTLVSTNAVGKFLMVYEWGADSAVKANAKDIEAITTSLQATK